MLVMTLTKKGTVVTTVHYRCQCSDKVDMQK